MDSTLNTNKCEFPLTTIIVPDKFNRGYPVAWLISSNTSELTLKCFLEETKSRYSDSFNVNCVITMTTIQGGTRLLLSLAIVNICYVNGILPVHGEES